MLKRSIILSMLCFAGHTFAADIVVNTTEDTVRADNQCSLREAIEYINQGRPDSGYNGCGGGEASNTIYLTTGTYQLNREILISKDVIFRTRYESNLTDKVLGRNNAVIKMNGTDRIFTIDRKVETTKTEDDNRLINVSFYEITLQGCAAAVCKDQGGLIYNKEILSFENSRLINGKAKFGGAIYTEGKVVENKPLSRVTLRNSVLRDNKAEKGAVLFSEVPNYNVQNSIIRDNEVTSSDSALFDALNGFDSAAISRLASSEEKGIQNSTIFNNKGFAIRVMDALTVQNITMIMNTHGLMIDAPLDRGVVANNILAKNGSEDCKIISGGSADKLSNNLYTNGCAGTQSQLLGSTKLIASATGAIEGTCDINSDGILCPFREYEDISLGFFRPRLLSSYASIDESPIVNKGPLNTSVTACMSSDQRSLSRINRLNLCDRGAIELRVDPSTINNVGNDILYQNVAKMSIADNLVDGELITPAQCQKLFGNEPNGGVWQPGCLKIAQTNTPSKGKLTLTQEGDITYQPNGDWHGSDEFEVLVVTTTTYFNDSSNKYIKINAKVVQEPPNDFKDYSVKTSGGSMGLGALLALIGMVGLRRRQKN